MQTGSYFMNAVFNSDGMIFHCALAVSAGQVRLGEDRGWVVLINHGDIITNTLPLLQHWWSPLADTTAGAVHVQTTEYRMSNYEELK